MPIVRRRPGAPTALAPTATEAPSTLRRLLAGGARVGSGVLATPFAMVPGLGTIAAAGIGGLGELGAELIEGSDPSLARAGVEAAISAVPLGSIIKGGRALQSAVRSGALSGTGEALRQQARGEEFDPLGVLLGTGLGAATGGLLGRFTAPASKVAAIPSGQTFAVEPTIPPGGRTLQGGRVTSGRRGVLGEGGTTRLAGAKAGPVAGGPSPITAGAARWQVPGRLSTPPRDPMQMELPIPPELPPTAVDPTQLRAELAAIEAAAQRAGARPYRPGAIRAEREATRLAEQDEARRRIEELRAGLEPQATVSETISAPLQGVSGTQRATIKYKAPGEEDIDDLLGVATAPAITPRGGPPVAPPPAGITPPNVERGEFDPLSVLLGGARILPEAPSGATPPQVVESFMDTLGRTYRGAAKAGVPEEEVRTLGALLRSEAEASGLPIGRAARAPRVQGQPTPEVFPESPGGPPTGGPWVDEALAEIEALKRRGPKGEKGAISNELLARLGLGAGGALIGGATDPLDNPLLSALLGAGAGAAIPSVPGALRAVGAAPEKLQGFEEQLKTPEGVMETIRSLGRAAPQVQRFNYLMSAAGLPANAFVGPYGSAVMGALTKGLAGDPRGWAALKELRNPVRFGKDVWASRAEAKELIRRGEGTMERAEAELPSALGTGKLQETIQWPGTVMTQGDLAARRALMKAGFTEEEARIMTLTSEPETPAMLGAVNIARQSPFLQMLFPFRRTPANLAEQGAHRIPGLGFFSQAARAKTGGTPDPIKEQIIQQLMGAGVGGAGYAAGSVIDPKQARYLNRYLTNVSGAYGLPMAIGLALGEANQRGLPSISGPVARAVERAIPLPTAEPLTDLLTAVGGEGRIPRGAIPSIFYDVMYPPAPRPLPTGRRPLRRRQQ